MSSIRRESHRLRHRAPREVGSKPMDGGDKRAGGEMGRAGRCASIVMMATITTPKAPHTVIPIGDLHQGSKATEAPSFIDGLRFTDTAMAPQATKHAEAPVDQSRMELSKSIPPAISCRAFIARIEQYIPSNASEIMNSPLRILRAFAIRVPFSTSRITARSQS